MPSGLTPNSMPWHIPRDDDMLTPTGYPPPPTQQPTWPTAHTALSQHCGHTALPPGQKTTPRRRAAREGAAACSPPLFTHPPTSIVVKCGGGGSSCGRLLCGSCRVVSCGGVVLFVSWCVLCYSCRVVVCVACFSSYTPPSPSVAIVRSRPSATSRAAGCPRTCRASSPPVFTTPPPVARTVVAPPSSVVKCLWEVFVWGFGLLFLSCVCRCRGCCSLSVCV